MTGHFRTILAELTRALAVLAFAFLSFAHQPLAVERYGRSPAVTEAFICGADLTGDPADSRDLKTYRCDACRVASPVDLPPPPIFACPVLQPLGLAFVSARPAVLPAAPVPSGGGPRAPPDFAFA